MGRISSPWGQRSAPQCGHGSPANQIDVKKELQIWTNLLEFHGDEPIAALLETLDDLADESTLDGIGLEHDEGAFGGRHSVFLIRGCGGAGSVCKRNTFGYDFEVWWENKTSFVATVTEATTFTHLVTRLASFEFKKFGVLRKKLLTTQFEFLRKSRTVNWPSMEQCWAKQSAITWNKERMLSGKRITWP